MSVFLTMDVEEWFDLDYLRPYDLPTRLSALNGVNHLTDLLGEHNIKCSFFVLDHVVQKHPELLRPLLENGHELACHGLNHELLTRISDSQFKCELTEAKNRLEDFIGKSVLGYRAPCFSMTNSKLEIVKELGFNYDSSCIDFAEHPLYGTVNLNNWNKVSNWIYEKDGFYEFKIPTFPILGKKIPISGGGYLRLFPFFIFRNLVKKSFNINQSYLFYIHPFECSPIEIPMNDVKFKDKFRFQYGRGQTLSRLKKLIQYFELNNANFSTLEHYLLNGQKH